MNRVVHGIIDPVNISGRTRAVCHSMPGIGVCMKIAFFPLTRIHGIIWIVKRAPGKRFWFCECEGETKEILFNDYPDDK